MSATVRRPVAGDLRVSMPYAFGETELLREVAGSRARINCMGGYWAVSRPSSLWWFVEELTARLRRDVVIELEFASKRCDIRCRQASPTTVETCVCSCLGQNHGGGGSLLWAELDVLVDQGVTVVRYLSPWAVLAA